MPDESSQDRYDYNLYGGSDLTQPSFNRPRYVRYGSVHTPRDFGDVDSLQLDLQGLVGAESGTQTLFFRFNARKRSRVGIRKIRINRYTDQYIDAALQDGDGKQVPIGVDGFARSSIVDGLTAEQIPNIIAEIGYVFCGYWDKGYAEYDCFEVTFPARVFGDGSAADDPFDPFYGEVLPAGPYAFTVSSSQWPQLPYRIQLVVYPEPKLSGDVTLSLTPVCRIGLSHLGGVVDLTLDPTGRLPRTNRLSGQAALQLNPTAKIARSSPFG